MYIPSLVARGWFCSLSDQVWPWLTTLWETFPAPRWQEWSCSPGSGILNHQCQWWPPYRWWLPRELVGSWPSHTDQHPVKRSGDHRTENHRYGTSTGSREESCHYMFTLSSKHSRKKQRYHTNIEIMKISCHHYWVYHLKIQEQTYNIGITQVMR